nr:hypothetical protein [uncultured Prevotella sp.]
MSNSASNFKHEECNTCEHGRNCINGKYCQRYKMYVQHMEKLPCKQS